MESIVVKDKLYEGSGSLQLGQAAAQHITPTHFAHVVVQVRRSTTTIVESDGAQAAPSGGARATD